MNNSVNNMTQDVILVLDAYINAWDAMDFSTLQSLWHTSESEIYYLAEESDRPFYIFSDVINYWEYTRSIIEWLSVTATQKHCKFLTDELCILSYEMHVDASMTGSKKMGFKPIGVDVRVSAILRNTSEGWRFIHYAEAPLGALPFVRRTYNANVRTYK